MTTPLEEYKATQQKMRELEEAGDMDGRNALVPRILELSELVDWGFQKGEMVQRWAGKTWVDDVIGSVRGNTITFYSVIMPGQLVRKKPPEQISLFEEVEE